MSRAKSLSLYRQLLRTALKMPDDHRTQLVVFRARSEFERNLCLKPGTEELQAVWLDAEVYIDQLEFQAEHLSKIQDQNLLIPVDLRRNHSSQRASKNDVDASTESDFELADMPTTTTRRRLVHAIAARRGATSRRTGSKKSFMVGPQPSWTKAGSDGKVDRSKFKT
ncbi:hypothetical protein OIO90_002875 [Microbotryomycetes sp. JL221]|nr:hypothetical protein OIO90_002875 [Microbotryomycetes sp. JL221]